MTAATPSPPRPGKPHEVHRAKQVEITSALLERARCADGTVLGRLNAREEGLGAAEVAERLLQYGPNQIARTRRRAKPLLLLDNVRNPLIILLLVLGLVSWLTGDLRAALVVLVMVILGVVLRFVQESRADNAAARLQAMVSSTATVVRDGREEEIPLSALVPGDVIRLGAGDMVPADVRLLVTKDLFLNQSALTGEAMPVEKRAGPAPPEIDSPLELPNVCFLGSNVESGAGRAVVVHTGGRTYFGALAANIGEERQLTSFDQGVNGFTWLMIRFIAVMVPTVFVINGLSRGNWVEAFLFAVAVAVGLTPEMLPMIVTVNLSKGAIAMARDKVIVKRLNSIQNLGAMDVLCTDKTGTLTEGRIVLERHVDVRGNDSERVLHYGYLNSYHHTGLKNLLDEAILDHEELEARLEANKKYRKIDEIPFDFVRRRMSVIVEDASGANTLICKGAVEEVLRLCTQADINGTIGPLGAEDITTGQAIVDRLNAEGFRVIALAYKDMPGATDEPVYEAKDEAELILLGFLAFLDPPKATAREALARLDARKVQVKVLTGDNEIITRHICRQVGMPAEQVLLGSEIEGMDDVALADAVEATSVFAKLVPAHKERIIRALQSKGHVLGFLGDGINDAPALKAADVGISVNSAVDIAKESSDIILLETSLLVLEKGVVEGRRVFGNVIKYIKMAASSSFGNMFSVVGASAFLPFVPMLPIQVLINNLLYDFSQTAIPSDRVDPEWLSRPRKWTIADIQRFILCIGPISSIFDYLTFWIMLALFHARENPALFHTGWFVESLFTQTLIIHVIRTNKIPFLQSRASWPLLVASVAIPAMGLWLTVSPLAGTLGFVALPPLYWPLLAAMLAGYMLLTQGVKSWFVRKHGE
jgi:P-type Mg2+ transporter